MSKVLVTGCAGFIGSHLTKRLLQDGHVVVGIDAFLDNYDVSLKLRNLSQIGPHPQFTFHSADLQKEKWDQWLEGVETIYHLAALPGVRSSWGKAFSDYANHNILAVQQLLEACVNRKHVESIVVSSSSSVYGTMLDSYTDEKAPLNPISPYGVTKAAMEYVCRVYVEAHQLPVVMLRYFTVYGPRQRPDMAFHRFIRHTLKNEPITIYGDGLQSRDFTYVSDAVEANLLAAQFGKSGEVFNVGGDREVRLLDVIEMIGKLTLQEPKFVFAPSQAGDSRRTCADISLAASRLGYAPRVTLEQGLRLQLEDMTEEQKGYH
ncbi:NAD-dependent epimerase/dehydratase family protein [Brevibacillus sp. H7]|uniref:NAD-dependent epimerase/dehydratase family protein n=1 Tax=Brevibacillus sp. H7 TaxID=3349138 RepID=UPI0038264015